MENSKAENLKVCPFASAIPGQNNSSCHGKECACYIILSEPRIIQTKDHEFSDPEHYYRYSGCGLVTRIPWKLIKIEEHSNLTNNQENKTGPTN